jgi:hypothetical protein
LPLERPIAEKAPPFDRFSSVAERGGTQLKTPRAVLLVDTREQNPFHFSRFEGWFSGIEKKALKLGDYSVAGLEEICAVERKDLSDLVHSCTVDRRWLLFQMIGVESYLLLPNDQRDRRNLPRQGQARHRVGFLPLASKAA